MNTYDENVIGLPEFDFQPVRWIAKLFSCDIQKLYFILTLTKTLFLICLKLSQHHISLKPFHTVSSSCTCFFKQKYLLQQNLLSRII